MNTFRNILIGFAVLIAIFVGGAYVLPGTARVSRSIEINAPATKIFALVNDLKKTRDWSPWAKIDPKMKQTFTGPDAGVGQKFTWQSDDPNVGNGSQEITKSVPPGKVETKLDFGENGTAEAAINIVESNGVSRVTWSFKTELGSNPVMRWLGLMFDGWIGKEYEKGLNSLKQLAEKS